MRTATEIEFELSAESRKAAPDHEKMQALNEERAKVMAQEAERLRTLGMPDTE